MLYFDRLADVVSLWQMGCNMELAAAQTAFDAMKSKGWERPAASAIVG